MPAVQGTPEPGWGSRWPRVTKVNEPIFGIQITFRVTVRHRPLRFTRTRLKWFLTRKQALKAREGAAKTQIGKNRGRRNVFSFKKANKKQTNLKLSPGVDGFHWRHGYYKETETLKIRLWTS